MSDLRDFCPLWNEWYADTKLGEGSYGAVWKMKRDVIGGRVYYSAVKHISIPKDDSEVNQLMTEGVISSQEDAKFFYDDLLKSISAEIDAMYELQGYTNIVTYEDHAIIPKPSGIGYDLFLRMELLTPLTEKLKQGLEPDDVVTIGKDIATALSILEDHRLIHRDIKPQNIFMNDMGVYKLGDYGTARGLSADAVAMSRKGTFNYMSPEIYNGQEADIRADIYSLGIVMYRLLNGSRLPFLPTEGTVTSRDNDSAGVRRLSGEQLPAPKNADGELTRIVLKACAYDPNDRYRSPKDLIRDLERYQARYTEDDNEKTVGEEYPDIAPAPDIDPNDETVAELPPPPKPVNPPVPPVPEPPPTPAPEPPKPVAPPVVTPPPTNTGTKKDPPKPPTTSSDGEKKGKKKWLIPLIAILVLGLAVGGLFAAGILPPDKDGSGESTKPPVITTEPPVITTEPPIITTEPPVITTVPPTETPPAPEPVPEEKWVCSNCGFENAHNNTYCENCALPEHYCLECGWSIPDGDKYCTNCATRVGMWKCSHCGTLWDANDTYCEMCGAERHKPETH
ncbi:MAG: protein kinase [Clostridia bacterium]|nr:protein kinase [Clostridia bacterium]